MKHHVLPGDSLTEIFERTDIEGEIIICRECLVEGDLSGDNLDDFWRTRAAFIAQTYDESTETYIKKVASEFEKLKISATPEAKINLWFEHELFCQVNLWFCLYLLRESEAEIYRVMPFVKDENDIWKGFGNSNPADLNECFAARIKFKKNEILLGADLWKAFRNADFETLERLAATKSKCFPFLSEVCRAASEKKSKPKQILQEIIADGKKEFAEIFSEFSQRAGIYGFGDSQVKRVLAEI